MSVLESCRSVCFPLLPQVTLSLFRVHLPPSPPPVHYSGRCRFILAGTLISAQCATESVYVTDRLMARARERERPPDCTILRASLQCALIGVFPQGKDSLFGTCATCSRSSNCRSPASLRPFPMPTSVHSGATVEAFPAVLNVSFCSFSGHSAHSP